MDDDDVVVVRGGELDPVALRADAERYHSISANTVSRCSPPTAWPSTNSPQQAPLVRFEVATLVRVGVLRAAGFRLEPTGRNPRHFTVAFDDLEASIGELRRCEQPVSGGPTRIVVTR